MSRYEIEKCDGCGATGIKGQGTFIDHVGEALGVTITWSNQGKLTTTHEAKADYCIGNKECEKKAREYAKNIVNQKFLETILKFEEERKKYMGES